MTAQEMWLSFIEGHPKFRGRQYDAWCFGINVNELAELVLNKIKTATASAHELYKLEDSPLPAVGGLNIILDAKGDAVCITETTKVYICPFNEISASHAFKEGEGDRSLEYWYSIHT